MADEAFALRGGHLALDFANTVGWHAHEEPTEQAEYLTSYARFLAWARQTGALADDVLDRLAAFAAKSPSAAAAALGEVIALREAVYHLFSAQAAGRALPAADLAVLNAALAEAHAHLRVVPTATGPEFGWAADGNDDLTRPLWPVVRAAAALLTAPERARVRECAGGSCGWLFLDTSRNGSRRWCDSRDCGNRERVRRHYARQKRGVERVG
jgi:predicted RNA-binding Zn ribbon-like protein